MKGVLRTVFENNVGFHCLLKTRCGSRGGGASLYNKNQRSCRTNGSPIIALGFPGGSAVKSLPAMQKMQEIQVRSLGVEDSLEEEMATQSSILAWRITWTEEFKGLQSVGSQRVECDCHVGNHSPNTIIKYI